MADSMSIDKKEHEREGSDDSMGSTPEAEPGAPQDSHENHDHHPDAVGQPKRKGGRKPVCLIQLVAPRGDMLVDTPSRSMPLPKSGSSVTARLRLRFENAERSTSSSWKRPSGCMRPTFTTCKPPIGVQLTSVSC
jgi:hypothetical protein